MQDLSNRGWQFGADLSEYLNPADFMGISNVTGTEAIYNGDPKPPKPQPTPKRNSNFKWVLYARKLRKRNFLA